MPSTAPVPLSSSRPALPRDPSRDAPARRRRRPRDVALVVSALVVLVATLVVAAWAGLTFGGTASTGLGAGRDAAADTVGSASGAGPALDPGATGEAGGLVPDGTTAFDVDLPALAGLDPRLLDALQRAATDASADGVDVVVNSGWRSAAYQEQLLRDAVAQYGSAQEAARWVATPATSAHVGGDAVDIGSWDATAWFSGHGAAYDLCQIYENETWHYELRDGAARDGCPPMYRDPTEDPRMRA